MVTTRRQSVGATPAKARSAGTTTTTPNWRRSPASSATNSSSGKKAAAAAPATPRTPRGGRAAAASKGKGKAAAESKTGGGSQAKAKAIRLVFKALGIYACFIYWGIVQERVTTSEYQPAPGWGGKPGKFNSMITLNGSCVT